MKASRAAVRQAKALEKMATSMGRVESLLGWMIANLQESRALPELPYELQELEANPADAPLEEEESTESSSEDDEGESEAPQPEELEADSEESAVRPTEKVSLPVTKVGAR